MNDGIAANQTSQSPLHLRVTDGDLTATLGTFAFEAQTVPLTPNATNYVFLDLSQNPPLLTVNTTGFPASAVWTIATAVTNDTQITQLTDSRPAFNNLAFSSGGIPGGATTQLQYNNAGAFGGIAESTYIPGSNLLIIADPNLGFEVLSGPSEQNGIIVSNAEVTIQAGESGSGIQLNADSDITLSSGNGDFNLSSAGGGITVTNTGVVSLESSASPPQYQILNLPVFANNAAAISGGLTTGELYRSGADPDVVRIVH